MYVRNDEAEKLGFDVSGPIKLLNHPTELPTMTRHKLSPHPFAVTWQIYQKKKNVCLLNSSVAFTYLHARKSRHHSRLGCFLLEASNFFIDELEPSVFSKQKNEFKQKKEPSGIIELRRNLMGVWWKGASSVRTSSFNVINLAFAPRKCLKWIYHYAKCLFHASLINICRAIMYMWVKKYGKSYFRYFWFIYNAIMTLGMKALEIDRQFSTFFSLYSLF